MTFPPPRTTPSGRLRPRVEAISCDHSINFGLGGIVGLTRDQQAFGTCLEEPPTSKSPGVSSKKRLSHSSDSKVPISISKSVSVLNMWM